MAKVAQFRNSDQIERVRRFCLALPSTTEKLSHGEPTFFAGKKVFAMFANNHHGDGHVAVWIPKLPGEAEELVHLRPKTFYRPPYVGVRGWVAIDLVEMDDDELGAHLAEAWKLIVPKRSALAKGPSTIKFDR